MDDYTQHDGDLQKLAWRALPIASSKLLTPEGYLYKLLLCREDVCALLVTDYKKVYFEAMNSRQLERRFKSTTSSSDTPESWAQMFETESVNGGCSASMSEGSYDSLTVQMSTQNQSTVTFNLDPLSWPLGASILSSQLLRPALGVLGAFIGSVQSETLTKLVDKSSLHANLKPDGLGKVFENDVGGKAMLRWALGAIGSDDLPQLVNATQNTNLSPRKQNASNTSPKRSPVLSHRRVESSKQASEEDSEIEIITPKTPSKTKHVASNTTPKPASTQIATKPRHRTDGDFEEESEPSDEPISPSAKSAVSTSRSPPSTTTFAAAAAAVPSTDHVTEEPVKDKKSEAVNEEQLALERRAEALKAWKAPGIVKGKKRRF